MARASRYFLNRFFFGFGFLVFWFFGVFFVGLMADDDDDKGKTLKELIEEQNAFEEEALAKIQENWGNESRCTYHDGSISQPVFSCLTCLDSFGRAVGVCFGCSMACHLDHVIVELFDKRNFRFLFFSKIFFPPFPKFFL